MHLDLSSSVFFYMLFDGQQQLLPRRTGESPRDSQQLQPSGRPYSSCSLPDRVVFSRRGRLPGRPPPLAAPL
ncbi:unnamed protein product, partial [Heterosigma akashiwo]